MSKRLLGVFAIIATIAIIGTSVQLADAGKPLEPINVETTSLDDTLTNKKVCGEENITVTRTGEEVFTLYEDQSYTLEHDSKKVYVNSEDKIIAESKRAFTIKSTYDPDADTKEFTQDKEIIKCKNGEKNEVIHTVKIVHKNGKITTQDQP